MGVVMVNVSEGINMNKVFILFIGLLCVGVASGVLVSYLSNTSSATVNVQSPMSIYSSTDGVSYSVDAKVFDVFGGDTVTLYYRTKNLASNGITGVVKLRIDNLAGVSCADFSSVGVTRSGSITESLSILSSCTVLNSTSIELLPYTTASRLFVAHHEDVARVDFVLSPGVLGAYIISTKVTV